MTEPKHDWPTVILISRGHHSSAPARWTAHTAYSCGAAKNFRASRNTEAHNVSLLGMSHEDAAFRRRCRLGPHGDEPDCFEARPASDTDIIDLT